MKLKNKLKANLNFAAGAAGLLLCSAMLQPVHAANIIWDVAGSGDWDTTTANWSGDSTTFTDGSVDNVTFNNTAGGTIAVLGMSPTSTTVNNASGEYIFASEDPGVGGGAASILTGTLVKDGAGTLQLGSQNLSPPWNNPAYTNGFTSVAINDGLIEFAGHHAFGSAVVTMADGAAIRGVGSAEGRLGNNNEDIPNDFVLSGGSASIPMEFGGNCKDLWLAGNVSGPGGFHITGSHRTFSLSGANTFTGGVQIESTTNSPPALNIGSYNALGTGTLTANQTVNSGGNGGLWAGQNLDGSATDMQGNVNPDGVTNPIDIVAGRYFNVSGENNGDSLLLTGVISGDGTLRKHRNDSTVTLRESDNTYTGGTIIDMGTLRLDDDGDGTATLLGTGPVTLNDGTLYLFRANMSNALTVNGGKIYSDNGWGNNWSGDVTLNVDLTVEPVQPMTFSGTLSGVAGLIVDQQTNTVDLTGTNTYTGDTTVNSGTLKVNSSSIADTNKLVIDGGKVEPVGTETVDTLFFGGTQQDVGTYGSTSSTATNQDDSRFSGTGVVNVLTGQGIDQADILTFGLPGWPGIITGTDIAWTVPIGTDVTTLAPVFEVSFAATATPISGTTRNFTSPQTYSIESGDTTLTQVYTVTVTEGAVPSVFDWAAAADGDWSEATNWTDDLAIGAGPGASGAPFYVLNFNESGTYAATQDLNDPFQLNQLNLASTVTIDGTSGLEFVVDEATLPTINKNSGDQVIINVPVSLAADTTVGGTGGGWMNLNGAISGTGSLTMDLAAGVLQVTNAGTPSSYSGGTVINGGTLLLEWPGDAYASNPPLGTGPVDLNGGTLHLSRSNPLNALNANGGLIISENGFGSAWSGPITLNVDTTMQCNYKFEVHADISGAGGLIKTGGNPIWLNGTNTYTGDTTVLSSTLRTTGSSIIDTGKLVIDGGKVEPVGTETVGSLFFGAAQQAPGTYGSTSSSAPAPNQDDTRFSGTGVIVVPAASSPFETWAGGTGPGLGFDEDFNSDGVDNGIAFLLGATGPDVDANDRLPTATEDGSGNLVMQFDCLPSTDRGTAQLRVAHSNTLGSWTATVDEVPDADDAVADNNVTFVVVAGPVGPPATNTVTATIEAAAAAGGKLFGCLEATE